MFFTCRDCGAEYPIDTFEYRCPCGGLFIIHPKAYSNREFLVDRDDNSLWRYQSVLPMQKPEDRVTFGEGMTPLVNRELFGKGVHLKLEFMFPTGSFKDRGASVLISLLKEIGVKKVVEDSSGNAGASIAAYCAAAGIECDIYLPAGTSEGKVRQIQVYGANIVRVPGDRDETSRRIAGAARKNYYASHYYNPVFFEGTKTFAFEIWEQMGKTAPDAVFVPVGNGTLLLGTYMGFNELHGRGMIEHIPRILAVQSESCCPLYREYCGDRGRDSGPEPTIAEGIAIGSPVRKDEILEAVSHSGGRFMTVSDADVRQAVRMMGDMGIYIEPTSGTAVAALQKGLEQGFMDSDDTVVVPLTGHGLKKGG